MGIDRYSSSNPTGSRDVFYFLSPGLGVSFLLLPPFPNVNFGVSFDLVSGFPTKICHMLKRRITGYVFNEYIVAWSRNLLQLRRQMGCGKNSAIVVLYTFLSYRIKIGYTGIPALVEKMVALLRI